MDGRRTGIRNQPSSLSSSQALGTPSANSQHRTKASKRPKLSTLAVYTGVFMIVVSVVAAGYQSPRPTDTVAHVASPQSASAAGESSGSTSVDQIVAANVAATIAERANLPIAANVAERSISLAVESQLAQTEDNALVKPQILSSSEEREFRTHTVARGESIPDVAAEYGLSADTVRWANDLSTDALEPGRKLTIPPVDGVVYTVKNSDSVESIARHYGANASRIVSFNDLELGGLALNQQIMIPGGALPTTERPGYVAPQPATTSVASSGSSYSSSVNWNVSASVGNRYAFGNCTWYAFERRAQLGRPIGSFWGNGSSWAFSGRAAGFTVNNTPAVGAIAQWNAFAGGSFGYGHVGIVESVNSDGSITVSEMNYAGNFNRVTSRTISPASVSNFIH